MRPVNNYIAWARVSSARQAEEGWSLEQQEQRLRAWADAHGGRIEKLYVVTETASKHQERRAFKEMIDYARAHSTRLAGLLVMKIDRAARNMRDFVALETLEEDYGVSLISVTQPTEHTPSGRMMRRTFATFATFFTEQLSEDVKRAMRQRAEAGLFVTLAPYGYRNVRDPNSKRRVVDVDPEQAPIVRRIFDLYAFDGHTLDSLREKLRDDGVTYKPHQPMFVRSKLYELLTDRSYIGEVDHLGNWYPGTHQPLIGRELFERVQSLLGRRKYRAHDLLFAGNLITCGQCGRPITGESKVKQTRAGAVTHVYYRCARYSAPGHERVRVTEEEIDRQLMAKFAEMLQDSETSEIWKEAFRAGAALELADAERERDRIAAELKRVRATKDRLLNLRLAGEIDADGYALKHRQLRDDEARLAVLVDAAGRDQSESAEIALQAFELSQSLTRLWVSADREAKRRLLEIVCLNLTLRGATLDVTWRSTFDVFASGSKPAISAQHKTPLDQATLAIAGTRSLDSNHVRLMKIALGKAAA